MTEGNRLGLNSDGIGGNNRIGIFRGKIEERRSRIVEAREGR